MTDRTDQRDEGLPQVLDPRLRGLLVCPLDQAELEERDEILVCSSCGRVYPIAGGVLNMLVGTDIRPD